MTRLVIVCLKLHTQFYGPWITHSDLQVLIKYCDIYFTCTSYIMYVYHTFILYTKCIKTLNVKQKKYLL